MGTEFELKYRATEESLQALLQEMPGEPRHYAMQTTYYDTPIGRLSALRYTLRLRLENDTAVCTLKTPAPGGARGEWETECASIEAAIPVLCKLGCPEDLPDLVSEGLIPVCGARFDRIAKTIELPDCVLELALDKGVLTGGGREIPLCEVEVELKSGSRSVCVDFAEKMAQVYCLEPEAQSKFRRALALYQGEY